MSFGADAIKNPLHDKILEMQRKIQLLEGDRTAYYESSQLTIKKNRESIQQLRQENKKLHRKLANAKAGDEHIIKAAFQNRGSEKHAFRNMSGKVALNTMDQKVLSKVKRLNSLKHTTHCYQQRLKELEEEYGRRTEESSGAKSADAHTKKQEEEAMKLRELENSLEKAQFKCKEAENIMCNYLKLKSHLQDESLTFQGQLDQLEAEILKHREELKGLQVMNNSAQLSKEAAKAELQQQEELLNKERKEREQILSTYKRRVEEQKAQAEKVERRTQRSAMQQDEVNSEVQRSITGMTGEEEKSISTLEETFNHIKEVTGVTDIHEIVGCFIAQKETHQHLEKLRTENQTILQQLKEQKELLEQQFQDLKYSGEDKLSRNQQLMEEREQQLQAQQHRCDAAKENLDSLTKTLSTVRAGVEHLADKLQHIPLSEDRAGQVSRESPEFVLELLAQSEQKLQSLQKELQGKDLAAVMKEMEEEEFSIRIEGKLPDYNTRVNPPDDPRLDLQDSEEDSEEDNADLVSREALKRQSQLIVDSKSKKKPWNKRKGKF